MWSGHETTDKHLCSLIPRPLSLLKERQAVCYKFFFSSISSCSQGEKYHTLVVPLYRKCWKACQGVGGWGKSIPSLHNEICRGRSVTMATKPHLYCMVEVTICGMLDTNGSNSSTSIGDRIRSNPSIFHPTT